MGKSSTRKDYLPAKLGVFMAISIYVGNLPWSATEESVQELFSPYGNVLSVKMITDRETGRARGFGFVEMEEDDAGATPTIH